MTYLDADKLLSDEAVEAAKKTLQDHGTGGVPLANARAALQAAIAAVPSRPGPVEDCAKTLREDAEIAEQEAIRLGAEGEHLGEFEAKGIAIARRDAANRLDAALDAPPTPDGPASPVLGDEERERLTTERDEERAAREAAQVEVHKLNGETR